MKLVAFSISFIVVLVLFFTMMDLYNNTGIVENHFTETLESTGDLSYFQATFVETLGIGTVRSIEFTDDDEFLAIGISTASKLRVYNYNDSTECYDLISPQVSTSGLGDVFGVEFSDDTNILAVGHNTSPYIKVYDRSDLTFTFNDDTDLILDAQVFDLKFYDDEYLIVGGDFTNYLQIFKYIDGDYIKLEGTIDILPTARVWDIDFNKGYLFIATEGSPYMLVYRQEGDNLIKIDNPISLPSGQGFSIDTTDRGNIIVVGHTGSPYIKLYRFENEIFTEIAIDSIPTQSTTAWSVLFIDNTCLYVGGDTAVYKYKINEAGDEFLLQTNDLTTFAGTIYVMDTQNSLEGIAIGDSSGYDCYSAEAEFSFLNVYLSTLPDEIESVKQNGIIKEYNISGLSIEVIDQDYNVDIVVDYIIYEQDLHPLIMIIPILVVGSIFMGIVFYIKD